MMLKIPTIPHIISSTTNTQRMYFKISPIKKGLNGVSSAYFAEAKFSLYIAFAVGALLTYFIIVDVRGFSKMFPEEFIVQAIVL